MHVKTIVNVCLLLLLALPSAAQSWPKARPEARAGTRWWWFGSAVDSASLRWNLDQLRQVGIGAVELTPIYGIQGNERNELRWLSPEWMRALQYTEAVAREDSIEVDLANDTGWPFGGPWVPEEEAAHKMLLVDTTVSVKADIHAIEFTLPEKDRPYARLAAVRTYQSPHEGCQRVIALFTAPTRQQVKRAAPGGEGWVIDHFDREAVGHYLEHIDSAFTANYTPWPHTSYCDSYEVYHADWTRRLPDEFLVRRGYDLLDRLDRFVDGDAQVVSDYRETLSDLLYENFTCQWVRWAHERGMQVRYQAHGSPGNLLDLYAAADIPETEGFGLTDFGIKGLRRDSGFTRPNESSPSMMKYASSAAHVAGKTFTSSETFTWLTEHFRYSLSQMKPDLDLLFTCGINHMFFSGTPCSPPDAPWPGWLYYAAPNLCPANSIWRDAPSLMRYIERCQSFLQWGQPDNDFLVKLPIREMWRRQTKEPLMMFDLHHIGEKSPEFIRLVNRLDSLGYDCDYISERQLSRVRESGDSLVTEGGTRYRALIDPGQPLDSARLRQLATPEEMRTRLHLRLIRRRNDQGWHYFIANLTPDDVDDYVSLAVPWQDALWFNPLNGERYGAERRGNLLRVTLKSGESLLLETFSHPLTQHVAPRPHADGAMKMIDTPWTLQFVESAPKAKGTWRLGHPQTWETLADDSARVTMGTGAYTTTFTLSRTEARQRWAIDLGDVRESARVYLNGHYVGCAWAVPYTLDCKHFLRRGRNELRIEVTNLPANRIADMDRRGVKWRIMKDINMVNQNYKKTTYADWQPVKSGLAGEVKLIRMN